MESVGIWIFASVLPVVLILHMIIPNVGRRNAVLIAAGLLMIGLIHPLALLFYLFISRITFKMALNIRRGKLHTLLVPLGINLLALFLLKYLDAAAIQLGLSSGILLTPTNLLIDWLNGFGLSIDHAVSLAPVGIGFYTLSVISYLVYIYRGRHPAEKRYGSFMLYLFLFPKFFNGPVVRYGQIVSNLNQRRNSSQQVLFGMLRFVTGLGKKVLLADVCGRMILELAESGSRQSLIGSWLAAVLFFFQIYFDFSGCCDMAIGLGRVFGFRFPENFKKPYQAMSVTEFCECWNITVRKFFLDYVYYPMGAKKGVIGKFVAAVAAAVLYGLWHGGSYNFIIFGVYFAAIITIEKHIEYILTDLPYWLRHTLTVLALMLGWVIFSHENLAELSITIKAMIGDGGFCISGDGARVWAAIPTLILCWIGVTSIPENFRDFWRKTLDMGEKQKDKPILRMMYYLSCIVFMIGVLWLCIASWIQNPALPPVMMSL